MFTKYLLLRPAPAVDDALQHAADLRGIHKVKLIERLLTVTVRRQLGRCSP